MVDCSTKRSQRVYFNNMTFRIVISLIYLTWDRLSLHLIIFQSYGILKCLRSSSDTTLTTKSESYIEHLGEVEKDHDDPKNGDDINLYTTFS